MSSQVFYRKWRPQNLSEVIGQDAITHTLKQALLQSRLAHAYLFCGPRGTGKTSTARILAKAINCQDLQDGEPCNSCNMCQSINQGSAVDLIEIDAASHRRIDDIRNINDKVRFSPNEATYKVYIIDEVHMLTSEAFNALLKTLEEPPEHVIFVLATTEPHMVPLTIVSRCQRFDFHRITPAAIVERLARLCQQEGITAEPEALAAISRAASGSLRDAENMLEQVVVSSEPPIGMEHVEKLLGLSDNEKALELVGHVLAAQVQDGLRVINGVAAEGHDLRQMEKGVVEYLRGVLLLKSGIEDPLGYTKEVQNSLKDLAQQASMEQVLHAITTFAKPTPRREDSSPLHLELALIEAVRQPVPSVSAEEQARPRQARTQPTPRQPVPQPEPPPVAHAPQPEEAAPLAQLEESPPPTLKEEPAAIVEVTTTEESAVADQPVPEPAVASAVSEPPPQESGSAAEVREPLTVLRSQWIAITKGLRTTKFKKFFLGPLLVDCKPNDMDIQGEKVLLRFTHKSHMERMEEELDDPRSRDALDEALSKALDASYHASIELSIASENGSTVKKTTESHLVRAALSMGARIASEKGEVNE